MEACPDLDPERSDRLDDLLGAADRSRGAVEADVEAVARRVLLLAPVSPEEAANDRVVSFDEPLPSSVAELRLLPGRVDDVGEQDRREHLVGLPDRPPAGHELLHLVDDRVGVSDEWQMIHPGELHVRRTLDLVGDVAGLSLQDDRVVLPVEHQGWDMDRGEHVADVHVGEDPPELLVGARARDEPLEPRPPRDEALVGSDRRRLQRQVLPGAHLANEPFEEHPLFFRGLAVRESRRRHRLRDGRVQDEGSRTVRMGRREQHRHRRRTSSTEHDRVRRSGGVHHGADVIALQHEHGGLGPSVGESHTPHVEEDQP